MSEKRTGRARLPPRWFIRSFWTTHRYLYRVSGGRFGLRRAKDDRWGMMHLSTIGRQTGQERGVILGYLEDGPNVVAMAMNGWADGEPAWWLNVQACPEVTIDLTDGPRSVKARAARGEERERLWDRWREVDKNLDAYAARRSEETAIVIFEPSPESALGNLAGDSTDTGADQ
jgi:deazaflavin-dependent oxidoreductase (nitroreductase family)